MYSLGFWEADLLWLARENREPATEYVQRLLEERCCIGTGCGCSASTTGGRTGADVVNARIRGGHCDGEDFSPELAVSPPPR